MKRDENLKTLSWEHHFGLVVAFRLQQGLKNGAATTVMKKYILHIWEHALRHHFRQEEDVINPALKKSHEGKKVIQQMMDEHQTFRDLIMQIKTGKVKTDQIKIFADILNRHIRFEERQLFPFLETHTSREELAEIGDFLRRNYSPACHDWQPVFWGNGSRINR